MTKKTITICLQIYKRGILLTDGLGLVAFQALGESIHSMSYCSYGYDMNSSPHSHYMQVPKQDLAYDKISAVNILTNALLH